MSVTCVLTIVGKPIFSVDIHPDGSRFATGGQGKLFYHFFCIVYHCYVLYSTFGQYKNVVLKAMTVAGSLSGICDL